MNRLHKRRVEKKRIKNRFSLWNTEFLQFLQDQSPEDQELIEKLLTED